MNHSRIYQRRVYLAVYVDVYVDVYDTYRLVIHDNFISVTMFSRIMQIPQNKCRLEQVLQCLHFLMAHVNTGD